MNQLNKLYQNARILFLIDNCDECSQWKKFIERLNSQIAYDKRIKVIDATLFNEYGTHTHPLFKVFSKYIEAFPTLFFDGRKIENANTRIEVEAYIRSALHNDFILPITNKFISDRDCRYVRKGLLKKKITVCHD